MRRKMRLHRLARKTRFWPVELTPGVQIDATGGMGVKPPQEGEVTTIQLPAENLTEARLTALKAKLQTHRQSHRSDAGRAPHGLRLQPAFAGAPPEDEDHAWADEAALGQDEDGLIKLRKDGG